MSKSLQKCILFAVCIALVCALGVTLFIFDGTGGAVTGQEGQASGVADAAANAYEHGTDSGRRPAGTYTSVSTGEAFYNAIKSNTQDILLTGNITLTSTTSTSGNFVWNDNSQCFMQNTPFNYKIYGAGYTITIIGPHTSSQGMQMNSADSHDYGGLVSRLESSGAIYDLKVVITKGFSVETWECYTQTWPAPNVDYWLNVGGIVGYMSGGAVIDNVYVELAESSVRLASFKYNSRGSTSQYVRAGGIVGEMGSGATITNVTVNNKGLIVAGQNSGSGSHSLATERYWGAAGNVVGWAAANGGNITIDNVRTTGNGIIRSYKSANIGVGENSNITTANFYDNFTGTYDSAATRHNVYLNGETGSNFYVTNVYRKGTSSNAGSGVEDTATGLRIANTLTVPSDSAYDIYFDATVSDRNNSLAIAFNQAPAASYKYTLVSGNGNTYKNPETTSNAIVFRNLPTDATIWKSGDNFSATLNSELPFNPDTYENPLTKYEHGYTEGQTTSSGRAIATGEEWENIFAPSANGTPSGTYYLTNNIVINGFTGKEMSDVTIDGNGKTIFVIGATQSSYSGVRVGGLVGGFTKGTIKNVRVVYINSCSIASTGTNPRFGLVAGSVNGSTIENVQVYVESGVTISASKAGDNSVAMGGVVGYATNNSKFTNVTLDLNGTLAPTGSYQYLGGIVGLIDSANGATFTNIILRGAGTFAGTAGNTSGEPTYYGAVGVIMAASTNITSAYATIDGLIYDFDVKLAGTGGGGQSNNSYSCYYLFTNNYNAGASGGHKTDSPISGYEGGVTYSNIFVAEKYVSELEGFAGERTNGNAAVGIGSDTTIKAIAGEVTGVSGATVTAYFVPTGNNSDITLAASQPSGGWGGVSQLKSDGDSSAQSVDDGDMKVVTVAKANAATDNNKVTLSEYVPGTVVTVTGVAPQLVYSAAEQGATFTFEGGSPELTTHYSVVYAVNDEDPKGAQLGDTGLPLNAGNYTATITLNEDSGFVFTSADGGYTRQTTFEFAVNPYELTLQSGIATALAGTYGDYTVTSGAVSGDKITSLTQETLFGSSVPGTVAYTVTVADQSDGLLNASTYSFTAGVSDTNYNLASGAIDGVVVSPYRVEGTWALDGGLTLTYGDPFPSNIDQYISVALTSTGIPGGLTSVTASGFTTDYTQGTAAGETVNITAGTYSVDSGLTAGNYDFTGITGSGTVEVQKKTLNINPVSEEPDYMYDPHISAVYGATGDKTAVQAMLTWDAIGRYIEGNYNGEEVSFTIDKIYIAAYDEESGAFTLVNAEEVADERIASLGANSYLITVTADGGNYAVAEGQFFVYGVTPATLTVTGVTFEGGFNGVYDGQAHNVTVQYSGLVGSDVAYNFNITVTGVDGIAVTNAGDYTVTVAADEDNPNYDVAYENGTGDMNAYTVTVEKADYDMTGVTFEDASFGYDGTEKAITVSGALPTGADGIQVTVSYSGTNGTALTNAGSTEITATFATTSANYNVPKAKTATLTVTPKDVTFAWSVSGEIVEGTAVEEVKALATETNNGGILEADTYTFSVDIGDYSESTLKGTAVTFTPSVTFTEEGDAANYNITFSPETDQLTVQLGEVEIAVTQATVNTDYVNGYTSAAQFLANFTTSVPDVTIDGENFTVTVTRKDVGAVGFGSLLDVGEYTVTLTSSVYNLTGTTTYTYQVTATVAVISWEADTDLIYNGAEHTLTATVKNKVESDEVNVTVSLTEDTDNVNVTAEGFTFTATGLTGAAAGNYTLDGASNLTSDEKTIIPATLNITQTAEETLTRPYDGTTTEATSFLTEKYVTITGGVSGENIYDMLNAEIADGGEIKNAGAYTITVTFNSAAEGAGNYSVGDFTSLEIVYEVTAKTITITFDGYEGLTYNGQARTLTATADFVSGENIVLDSLIAYTGNVTDGKAVNAGSYTATITKAQIEEKNTNYTLAAESATQEFAISPATLTLTQTDGAQLSRVYDGTATEARAFVSADYFTVSGYVDGGDEYALFTAAVAEGLTIQNADSYTINITLNSGAEGAGNYTCETFAINYEVTPIQWTASVTAPEGGLTYDGENKLGSLVITPGDNEGTDIEGAPVIVATVSGGSMVNAGTYTVTLQLQTDGAVYSGGNYELTAESAKIEIAKRVVEISWAEASNLTYNGLEHTLTATVRNKVEPDEVNATVELDGNNIDVTEEGFTYTVTGLTGAAAANYTIEGVENLTSKTQYIVRATLTIQFEGISGLEYTGTAHTVTATATGWQKDDSFDLNSLITIDGAGTQVLNAGDYTATITKQALEEALGNYTLAQDATVEFTVAPATLNLTIEMKESGSGASVAKPFTWRVADAVTVSGNSVNGWTLTSGGTSYTVTVTGADGVASNVLQLTLNGSEYTGTPYGTRVEKGELAVASTDPNYTVVATPIIINIKPDISIEINTGEGYPVSAVYSKDKTYTAADDFAGYFYIDGQPDGTWDYSVEGVESGSFSNVGTYTVKATFTIASGIKLENHFTFNITQATVTGVVLNGEGAYTYGDLTADSTVSVTVTYSDGNTATVNAGFEAAASKGGYVKAGERVTLTLTGDDGKNANYAKVDGQTVTVSVSKAEITADIYYEDIVSADGVLTLTYHGKEGYVVSVKLTGVRDGDVIYGALPTQIIDAGTYNSFEIALNGDDSGSYVITNAAAFSVVVTPAEITVEWSNSEGFTYDGTAKAPTATAKDTFDSDEVTLTVTVTGETTEGQAINAGDYTATVKAFVNGNYKLSEDSEQPFSIAKATATLGIENYQDSVEYNGSAVTVTPTVNDAAASEGIVNVTIAYTADGSEAVTVDEIRNAGSYTVTLQISGALNYEDASKDFVITVTRAQLTVTTANILFTYDGSVKGIDRLGVSLSGAVAGDDVSAVIDSVVSGGEPAELKNAGSYTVTYRLEGVAAGNYMITEGGDTVEVKVNAKELTFTWNSDQTFTYNGEAQVPGYTLNGVVDGDEVTVTVTVTGDNETEVQAINAGVYTASVAEITKGNYSLTGVDELPFTIGKANLTLTPDSVKFSDRDADKLSAYSKTNYVATIKTNVTVTGVGSDAVFNDFTVTTDDDSFTGENGTLTVGNYTFTVSVAGGNYNDATYTVTVIEQTVAEFTAKPSSPTYTGGEITFTFENEEGIQLEEGVQIAVSGITFNNASADSVLNAGSYTVTFAVTGNSADNNYWYTVRSWRGDISPATVEAKAVTAVYGDVYTALETGDSLQHGTVWQFVTFKNSPVEVTVTVTDATARAGETYLGAGTHDVTVTLVSGNFTFAGGGNSVASTLQITRKQLNIAAQLPEDLTYTSDGIVIGLEDYASQLVGDDYVTVSMLVDGKPYVAGVTVLGAGQHTVTVTMKDTSGNYQLAAAQQTFTVEKKPVSSSITVSGETIENNSSLEIVHGENARVQNAIDNYLTQNGVEEGEYTLTVTNSAGQAANLDNISAWAPGTYTVNLGLSDNFEGGMTFTIVVQEGTTAQIPDAPVLPSTPLEDGGSSGVADWLFPLIIAIECLIAVALIVAIAVSAARRGKNA